MENKEKSKAESASEDKKITRKQALKKAGFYAATAAGMITLLGSPKQAAADGSVPSGNPPGNDSGW